MPHSKKKIRDKKIETAKSRFFHLAKLIPRNLGNNLGSGFLTAPRKTSNGSKRARKKESEKLHFMWCNFYLGNLSTDLGSELSTDLWENFVTGLGYPDISDYDDASISFFKPQVQSRIFELFYFQSLLSFYQLIGSLIDY